MIALSIKVEGIESLMKALQRLNLMEPAAEAIELSLDKVVSDAKAIVPVRTGTLQRSIQWWGAEGEYHVGSRVHYAPYVEYGTSRMAPRPYLTPALMQNIPLLRQTLRGIVEGYLETRGE
jgi:HK97 gp10 family phage protein